MHGHYRSPGATRASTLPLLSSSTTSVMHHIRSLEPPQGASYSDHAAQHLNLALMESSERALKAGSFYGGKLQLKLHFLAIATARVNKLSIIHPLLGAATPLSFIHLWEPQCWLFDSSHNLEFLHFDFKHFAATLIVYLKKFVF